MKIVKKIREDQLEFFKFQKVKHEWESCVYRIMDGGEEGPPFPYHLLGVEKKKFEKSTRMRRVRNRRIRRLEKYGR